MRYEIFEAKIIMNISTISIYWLDLWDLNSSGQSKELMAWSFSLSTIIFKVILSRQRSYDEAWLAGCHLMTDIDFLHWVTNACAYKIII